MTKTKKTLKKRIKITKSGKILKLQNDAGHLKVKWNATKKQRKKGYEVLTTKGYRKRIKKMLGKAGRKIK